MKVHLSLSTSSYSDVINGIDELGAAPLDLRGHHQDTGEGKQAWTKSSHFGSSLNDGPRTAWAHLMRWTPSWPVTLASISMNVDHHWPGCRQSLLLAPPIFGLRLARKRPRRKPGLGPPTLGARCSSRCRDSLRHQVTTSFGDFGALGGDARSGMQLWLWLGWRREGGRDGGRAAAASPRGLYKASLITAAWSLLASTHLPLTLIKFWVAPSYGSFCCILTSPSSWVEVPTYLHTFRYF